MLNEKDSPWYPSVALIRSEKIGDWAGVVQQITQQLKTTFSI
jgi:hypothetical protein